MPAFDQFDSFSNLYSANDESLKRLFPSSDIQKIIQQCLQTIRLFENAENIFYFSFYTAFLAFLHEFFIFIYITNQLMSITYRSWALSPFPCLCFIVP